MKLVLFILKSSWQKLLVGAIGSAIAGLCYAYAVKLLNTLIGSSSESSSLFIEMALMILVSTGLSLLTGYYLTKLFEEKISDLRVDLSRKILQVDFETVERNAHKIIPVLHYDVNNIGSFAKTIPDVLVAVFKIAAIWTYMFILSWQLTVSIVAVFLSVFLFAYVLLPTFHRIEKDIQRERNTLYRHLVGLVNGIKELTLNRQHQKSYVEETILPTSSLHARFISFINSLNILVTKSAELIVIIGIGIIILVQKSSTTFATDIFLDFLTLVLFILPSLIIITSFARSLKKVDASLEQVFSLGLEFDSYVHLRGNTKLAYKTNSTTPLIGLNQVRYQYGDSDSGTFKVGPFDLVIYENEVLFFNGGNGSGKTTLAKLLTGLYIPESGHLTYQDLVINEDNIFEYRNLFAATFTDSHVFQDLRYLSLTTNEEDMKRISALLGIDDKIETQHLFISDVDLSFGQRGRLNLLRVLLEDKPIYLFDEWAANQDPYFRSKFYNEILPGLKNKGKTVIVISHDDNYYHLADRIITLSSGTISDINA